MCNKVPYPTKQDASKDARLVRINSKRFSNGIGTNNKASKLYPYLCPICDNWHLTSLARNVAKTFRKKNVNIRKTDNREV